MRIYGRLRLGVSSPAPSPLVHADTPVLQPDILPEVLCRDRVCLNCGPITAFMAGLSRVMFPSPTKNRYNLAGSARLPARRPRREGSQEDNQTVHGKRFNYCGEEWSIRILFLESNERHSRQDGQVCRDPLWSASLTVLILVTQASTCTASYTSEMTVSPCW